jgi:hypothetical protein
MELTDVGKKPVSLGFLINYLQPPPQGDYISINENDTFGGNLVSIDSYLKGLCETQTSGGTTTYTPRQDILWTEVGRPTDSSSQTGSLWAYVKFLKDRIDYL